MAERRRRRRGDVTSVDLCYLLKWELSHLLAMNDDDDGDEINETSNRRGSLRSRATGLASLARNGPRFARTQRGSLRSHALRASEASPVACERSEPRCVRAKRARCVRAKRAPLRQVTLSGVYPTNPPRPPGLRACRLYVSVLPTLLLCCFFLGFCAPCKKSPDFPLLI